MSAPDNIAGEQGGTPARSRETTTEPHNDSNASGQALDPPPVRPVDPNTPDATNSTQASDLEQGANPDAPVEYRPPVRPPIVQWVPKKRGKRSDPALKRGKPSWVWGTKLVFFGSRKHLWLKAMEEGTQGKFYTKMAKLYVVKYDHTLGDKEDFEYDVEDPPDEWADRVVNEVVPPDVAAFRQKYHNTVRDRIGAWYCDQHSSLLKDDKHPWVWD
ncbi:hypothetical protein C8R43DRAFT_946413 [Mycena crocata]|nr:hypothetical protein C8R43DRAFT_946413 [Mycena crocata]